MDKKIALITGIGGQDGRYLSEQLISLGYIVHGLERVKKHEECEFLSKEIQWHNGDICDYQFVEFLLSQIKPIRIFNLAAQSEVQLSCDFPHLTTHVNSIGALNLLEAFRRVCPFSRFYQASSSEMFGCSMDQDGMQRETTCMNPLTPYGISKLYAHKMCEYYRKQFDLFIASGILFNHESPLRPERFLTTKVVKTAIEIKNNQVKELKIGNLNVSRDWGHSKDYTKSMIQMLDYDSPQDFVISTMKSHTVQYLIEYVFSSLNLDYKQYVVQDSKFIRKIDQINVLGDSSKARKLLGWSPSYSFESMLDEMISFWKERIN
jgi:GDPmannose 4,6-dehydratase